MKRLGIFLLLLCLIGLTGCDSKEALDYAKLLAETLRTYKAEVMKKIAAEQTSYNDLAAAHAHARQIETLLTLQSDRLRQAGALAERLQAGAKFSPAEIQKLVADYAKQDFDATRAIFERETGDLTGYLTGIESLELQAQNLDALIEALDELGKKKSALAQIKEIGGFAVQVRSKLEELACTDLARHINCLKAEKEKTEDNDRKKKIQEEIDTLTKQFNDATCADALLTKAKCP